MGWGAELYNNEILRKSMGKNGRNTFLNKSLASVQGKEGDEEDALPVEQNGEKEEQSRIGSLEVREKRKEEGKSEISFISRKYICYFLRDLNH